MPPLSRKQVFSGTFIHCKNKQELERSIAQFVYVDDKGKIARAVDGRKEAIGDGLKKLGWNHDEIDFFEAKSGQFFFPGFIGKAAPLH